MSTKMNSVAAASEQASNNIAMAVAATKEMNNTVHEIARNSAKARVITGKAVEHSNQASVRVDELGVAASEISKVTEVITDISEQTNLLALNATIEAARAGEAGKGFAIVANEIKEFAKQTAKATKEIKGKIELIQASTQKTVGDIKELTEVIDDVNEIVTSIATAIEEQSATTRKIAANITHAAQGITDVNENMTQSSTVSDLIARDVGAVSHSTTCVKNEGNKLGLDAAQLNELAAALHGMVNRFKLS
ncbi:MAG: hypothetical protein KJ804_06960 [Proteobacteria bacterium]|nr:hypothetical protein [Pseudomonadota bacterium]MBU1058038.1 hypothetical protein [Pseudomonadota bacterium]